MNSIKETDLYPAIKNTGPFAKKQFYHEIPIGDWAKSRKRIDLVVLENQKLISIEVKISNWKKVLQQAYANLYVFDYSYVALWHKTTPNIDTDIFKTLGIGILQVNGSCQEILKPKKSKLIIPRCKNYVRKTLENLENNDKMK